MVIPSLPLFLPCFSQYQRFPYQTIFLSFSAARPTLDYTLLMFVFQ